MPVEQPLPNDSQIMKAWEAYKATDDYANTRRWALHEAHVDGQLWAAFMVGWTARNTSPEEALLAQIRNECCVDENGDPVGAQPENGWENGYAAGVRHVYRILNDAVIPHMDKDTSA